MIIVQQSDLRAHVKRYFDMAHDGEVLAIPRSGNRNVVIISEAEYRDLEKARQNQEYLAKLARSREQIRQGAIITKGLDELEAMANE